MMTSRFGRLVKWLPHITGIITVSAVSFGLPITAAASGSSLSDDTSFSGGYFVSLMKVLLVLILMIGLIIWLIRFMAKKNRAWMSQGAFRPLGGIGLGPNRSLQIVEIGRSIYIIGVGEDIRLIEKIDDPEEIRELIASLQDSKGMGNFSGLSALMNKFGRNGKQPNDKFPLSSNFQDIFRKKMQQVVQRRNEEAELSFSNPDEQQFSNIDRDRK